MDHIISAEIPDEQDDPIGYSAVAQFMMHGPCGQANPKCACMKDDMCSKYFPKDYNFETYIDKDGYAVYKRREDGRIVMKNNTPLDNRYISKIKIKFIFICNLDT